MAKQERSPVIAFVGGELRRLDGQDEGREVALALPLSRLIMTMVSVPKETDVVEHATPILQKLSPFPDEALTVSCETVRETEEGTVVIAAALPESAADDIAEALDAAKLSVVRIDALVLGALRGLWKEIACSETGRKLILIRDADCISSVVLDGDGPSAIRAIPSGAELKREVMLSLLEAEDFGGPRKLEEIIVVESGEAESLPLQQGAEDSLQVRSGKDSASPFAALAAFAPLRRITVGSDAALVGAAERAADPSSLNVLPTSWQEVLEETRFKAKLTKSLAIAGGIWLLIMGVLFGVPVVYGFMTDHQKSLSKQHARQYKAVKDMKAKVDLIHKYSDHAHGALEIMKAISDRLPEGVTLSSWDYKREDGVRVRGDADTAEATYAFKDVMDALAAGEGEDGEKIFETVELVGPNASKGKYSFNLDCQYHKDEEE